MDIRCYGHPLLRIRDILRGETETYYDGPEVDGYWVEHGDLVVGMDGDFNCGLWPGRRALLNQRTCKLTPDNRFYSLRFLSYALPGYLQAINRHTSSLTVKHLSSRTIADLPLPLPPRKEQDRIAAKLDELFSRIEKGEENLKRVQALVKRYRQAVLKAAVTGELTRDWRERNAGKGESGAELLQCILAARRAAWEKAELAKMKAKGKKPSYDRLKQKYQEPEAPDTSDLPDLPKGWVWVTLDQLIAENPMNGISIKGSDTPPGIPALRLDALTANGLDLSRRRYLDLAERTADRLTIRQNDFLVSRANGSKRLMARAVLVENIAESIVFPDTIIRFRFVSVANLAQWISAIWESRLVRDQLERRAKTSAGIWKVSQGDILKTALPLPSRAEQLQMIAQMDTMGRSLDMLETEISSAMCRSRTLRQSSLSLAFSGDLVPQDSSDQPASMLLERISVERRNGAVMESRRGRQKGSGSALTQEALS